MNTPYITNDNHHFFVATCKNTNITKKAFSLLNRKINALIVKEPLVNNSLSHRINEEINVLTKVAIPTYTAYTESMLLKLLYTPYGFSEQEITQILKQQQNKSIIEAWKKAVKISTEKSIGRKSNFYPNSIKTINKLIDTYLQEPSQLRNKIAHGQWIETFNKTNTALNKDISRKVGTVTIVDINKWVEIFSLLSDLIKLSIQSPLKGYPEQYWEKVQSIETIIKKKSTWNFNDKVKKLHIKRSYMNS